MESLRISYRHNARCWCSSISVPSYTQSEAILKSSYHSHINYVQREYRHRYLQRPLSEQLNTGWEVKMALVIATDQYNVALSFPERHHWTSCSLLSSSSCVTNRTNISVSKLEWDNRRVLLKFEGRHIIFSLPVKYFSHAVPRSAWDGIDLINDTRRVRFCSIALYIFAPSSSLCVRAHSMYAELCFGI